MSSAIELVSPLHLDIASSIKLLLNRLNVNVKLQRTTAPWVLMTDQADNKTVYQVNINQAELLCKRVKVRCADIRRIEATLNRHPARYDYLSSSFFAITFPPKINQLGITPALSILRLCLYVLYFRYINSPGKDAA